jgi:hypothetical protein
MIAEQLEIVQRLERIEAALAILVERQTVKDWYSTEEAAELLGLAEFTVRNYCRLGRIAGEKKGSGRGKYQSWAISHDELERVRREGLRPLRVG